MQLQTHQMTPWGRAQSIATVTEGIYRVDTASHGGYYVDDIRRALMPAEIRDIPTFITRHQSRVDGQNWYEEDCDWALVVLAFPAHFKPEQVEGAIVTAMMWFEQHFNVEDFIHRHGINRAAA